MLDIIALIVVVTLIDLTFLAFSGFGNSYLGTVGTIQKEKADIRFAPALAVYALISLGHTVFVNPLVKTDYDAVVYGGLFGLVTYGVYDLTMYSLFTNYPISTMSLDILWGVVFNVIIALVNHNYIDASLLK
jgi:uncharacterized membrane protein